MGRLVAHKRLGLLLEAVADLQQDWPDLRLDIAGDGPARPLAEPDVVRHEDGAGAHTRGARARVREHRARARPQRAERSAPHLGQRDARAVEEARHSERGAHPPREAHLRGARVRRRRLTEGHERHHVDRSEPRVHAPV